MTADEFVAMCGEAEVTDDEFRTTYGMTDAELCETRRWCDAIAAADNVVITLWQATQWLDTGPLVARIVLARLERGEPDVIAFLQTRVGARDAVLRWVRRSRSG